MTVEELRKRLDSYRDAMERCIQDELFNQECANGDVDLTIAAEDMSEAHEKELKARTDVEALFAELEAERDAEKERAAGNFASCERVKGKFEESFIEAKELRARIAALEAENARFQWREGSPPASGWYLVTSDFNGYVSVHMCYWVKVNDSESGAWGTGPEAARRVLRWMEMPTPFRLTPRESSS